MVDSKDLCLSTINYINQADQFEEFYELSRKCIGRGEQCEFRLCKDRRNGQVKTVKVYRKSELTLQAIELIKRELRLLGKMDHPNIVKVQRTFEDHFKIYVVIEDIQGESLFTRIIRQGQLSEQEAGLILSHLLSAVKFMHKNGIIHRNLKPENIMFETMTGVSDIKLVDLISAVEFSQIKEEDPDFDTFITSEPHYRAPELLTSKKKYDFSVDGWSCGAILYTMVTGIPPFFEQDPESLKEKIKTGVLSCQYPNYDASCSKELKDLVKGLLQVQKEGRTTIDAALTHRFLTQGNRSFLQFNKKIALEALNNIKDLHYGYHFQKIVLQYMAKYLMDRKEKDSLQLLFECLDENNDGEVSTSDLVSVYKSRFNISINENELSRFMKELDSNKDRTLTFTEFLVGACSKQNLLIDSLLRQAFQIFDHDQNGIITRSDLKLFLNTDNEYILGNVIEEADDDCDGGVLYKEFHLIMMKLL